MSEALTREELEAILARAQQGYLKPCYRDHGEDQAGFYHDLDEMRKDFRDLLADDAALRREIERLKQERDLAIAHDRQPYPTAWAYEQACRALRQAEQEREQYREALELIATTNHGNYPENATPYETGIADGHRCAANWAHQALSQQPEATLPSSQP